jgi:hypothetical protein
MRVILGCVLLNLAICVGVAPAVAQQQPASPAIEKLLTDGWEIAGYISAWENRSLILFRHKEHKYLVQCSVLIDVMRNPRVVTYCHEIR